MYSFNLLSSEPLWYLSMALVLGLLVGSFLNVVIYRLPLMMEREWLLQSPSLNCGAEPPATPEPFNLLLPRSACPHCGHPIKALENIPVLSYLMLRGRCSACRAPISPRYPIVELSTGLLSLLVVLIFGLTPLSLALLLFTWALITLTLIDIDHQLLPDSITLPLLWLGLIINSFGWLTDIYSALWGAVAGYLILWSVYWLFKLITGKEGMGYGDFKLLAALGAWMGWQMLPLIIILSSLVGALIGIAMMIFKGRDRNVPIPFGPYLAIAGWVALLWGQDLTGLYLHSIGPG